MTKKKNKKSKRGFLPDEAVLQDILGSKGDSVLHKLDPRIKIFWFILTFAVGLIVIENLVAVVGLMIYVFVLGALAGVLYKQWAMVKIVFPLFIIVFLLNLFLLPAISKTVYNPIVTFGVKYPWYYVFPSMGTPRNIAITQESLYIAIDRGMVLLTLSAVAGLFILLIELTELIEGMTLLKLPYKLAFTLGLTINFIPILFYDLATILEAQKARGHQLDRGNVFSRIKASISLVLPTINCAYSRSGNIADAMNSRGFSTSKSRTVITEFHFSKRDYIFLTLSLLVLIIAIIIRLFFPFFKVHMRV